ncbi:hypothetical protein AAHC03_020760 [Spirometra sp. Aus1]
MLLVTIVSSSLPFRPRKSVLILVQPYRAMLSGLPSFLLRSSLHLLSPVSSLFAHRSTVSEFVPCSHDDTKNSRGQDIHWNRKFRRRLQNILQSGNWDESFGRVRIVDLRAGSDGRDMTVRWSMDEEDFAAAVNSQQFHEICHIGVLLNLTAPTIRQRLARENAFKKVPSLTFIHHSQPNILEGGCDSLKDEECTSSSETNSLPVTHTMTRPTDVYGLPWDKYMACVKREMKGGLGVSLVEESLKPEAESDPDRTKTARWARMWRQQNSARLQARRERKRSHQMLGLWQLTREMEALDGEND